MQSDDPGLVERLRRGPVAYTSAGGPVYNGADPLMDEAAAAIERLVARAEAAEQSLLWAMDEIDVLSNRTCQFAYPQGMAYVGRRDQLDNYRKAVDVRRARQALKDAP
jgi:hypothetical protein